MKKSIFLSVLALAAVVSCQKSEIVDSKYGNEAIGFETYTGRDAQTKATVASTFTTAGIYGFYTGVNMWNGTGTNTVANPKANLWSDKENETLTAGGVVSPTKYWTNDSDYYSFLAYAPKAVASYTYLTSALDEAGSNPTLTYTVPTTLADQTDLLYAFAIDQQKPKTTAGATSTVALTFKHALSRIAVQACEKHEDYVYTIKGLTLTGNFVQTNTFDLKTGEWEAVTEQTAKETGSYTFVLPSGKVAVNGATPVSCVGENYLMVIPADVENATLTVAYTTTYGEGTEAIESNLITKTVKVTNDFEQGKAYALNLEFGPNAADAIGFSVTVDTWGTENSVNVTPVNPEEGTVVSGN